MSAVLRTADIAECVTAKRSFDLSHAGVDVVVGNPSVGRRGTPFMKQSQSPQRSAECGPLRRPWRSRRIPRLRGWGGRIRTSVWRNQNPTTCVVKARQERYVGTKIEDF